MLYAVCSSTLLTRWRVWTDAPWPCVFFWPLFVTPIWKKNGFEPSCFTPPRFYVVLKGWGVCVRPSLTVCKRCLGSGRDIIRIHKHPCDGWWNTWCVMREGVPQRDPITEAGWDPWTESVSVCLSALVTVFFCVQSGEFHRAYFVSGIIRTWFSLWYETCNIYIFFGGKCCTRFSLPFLNVFPLYVYWNSSVAVNSSRIYSYRYLVLLNGAAAGFCGRFVTLM